MGAKMNIPDAFYDIQKIDHLPDARCEIAPEETAPEPAQIAEWDWQKIAGVSMVINALLGLALIALLWMGWGR